MCKDKHSSFLQNRTAIISFMIQAPGLVDMPVVQTGRDGVIFARMFVPEQAFSV